MPGRDPPLLLAAADQVLHLIPISVDVPIAVEAPVLVGSARDSRSRICRVGDRSVETLGGPLRKPVMKGAISG